MPNEKKYDKIQSFSTYQNKKGRLLIQREVKIMNQYESIIIVNPELDDTALKALEEKFTGLINENGKVESVENMGKKKLAYEIKKSNEGIYLLFNFEAKPDSIQELERVYRITDNIMKFIVVKKEN